LKLLLKRLFPLIEHNELIPTHQFGFRRRYSTIQQTHRIIHRINEAFEHKAYCSAAFLDISQAFDKVLAYRTFYKLRQSLPLHYFLLLQSYLHNRHFFFKIASTHHTLSPIHAGAKQGSVLGPLLYLMYTADLPTSPTNIGTFADDTAFLATDSDPAVASQKLQTHLLAIQVWLQKWRMQANALESVHVTFTTRSGTCPPVHMNNVQLPCEDHVKYLELHLNRKLTGNITSSPNGNISELLSPRWANITALFKQQTTSVQNHPQTDPDLWYPTLGHGFHIQHRDPGMCTHTRIHEKLTIYTQYL
jgi:hypothetical protein